MRLEPLKIALAKESFDVYKMESSGIGAALRDRLGSRNKRLEKERAEAMAARMRLRQAEKALQEIDLRLRELDAERARLQACKDQYIQLYAERKRQLLLQNGKVAEQIMALTEQMHASKSVLKEIEEARLAGQRVETWLCSAMGTLNTARGWSRWGGYGRNYLWCGLSAGRAAADGFKALSEQEAYHDVEKARRMMSCFQQELTDIRLDKKTEALASQMTMNWGMRADLSDSMLSVGSARTSVREILGQLEKLEAEEKDKLRRVKDKLEALVVNGWD